MFIQIEETPNPDTLKFIPGVKVLGDRTAQFNSKGESKNSPLAKELFGITGVKSVFLGSDFISVTKLEKIHWDSLKAEVLTQIMDHFVAEKPVLLEEKKSKRKSAKKGKDDEIVEQIKELIETRVRPAVAQDGGDIIFLGFKDGVVEVELHGACSGCPSASVTLKDGIENMLKHYVPEVERVDAVL